MEWAAISFSSAGQWKVKVKSLSRVRLLATPWTAAYQAPPSIAFSRQEYWSGGDKPRQHIKMQRHPCADESPFGQSQGFSSSHVRMWELNCKEGWAPKTWCFHMMVLESPLDCREIQPVHPEGNQSWIFTGRTVAEAEAPVLWPPDVKNWLWKRPWCWERLKAGGEGDDRGWDSWVASPTWWTWVWANSGRRWCSLWGHEESDTTERLTTAAKLYLFLI